MKCDVQIEDLHSTSAVVSVIKQQSRRAAIMLFGSYWNGQQLKLEQGSLIIHILVSSCRYRNPYGKDVTEQKSSSINDDH